MAEIFVKLGRSEEGVSSTRPETGALCLALNNTRYYYSDKEILKALSQVYSFGLGKARVNPWPNAPTGTSFEKSLTVFNIEQGYVGRMGRE